MRKMNKFTAWGILIVSLTLLLIQLVENYPEVLRGFGFGVGLVLEGMGFYYYREDFKEMRKKKLRFFKKCLGLAK